MSTELREREGDCYCSSSCLLLLLLPELRDCSGQNSGPVNSTSFAPPSSDGIRGPYDARENSSLCSMVYRAPSYHTH
jgi:hypothetical protein